MTHDDEPAFAGLMAELATVFRESLTTERVELYYRALRDMALSDVRLGVELCIRHSEFFPRPAEIRRVAPPPRGLYIPGDGPCAPSSPSAPSERRLLTGPEIEAHERRAAERWVTMGEAIKAAVASVDAKLADNQRKAAQPMTPADVEARKAALREQVKIWKLREG